MEPMTPSRRLGADRAHAALTREGRLTRSVMVARGRGAQVWLQRVFGLSFALGAASCAGGVMGVNALLLLWFVAVVGMLASAIALSVRRKPVWSAGEVLAAPGGGVSVVGARGVHVTEDGVRYGWIEVPHRAMLETTGGDVIGVACADDDEAVRVLSAVGVTRPGRVARVELSSAAERTAFGRPLAVAGLVVSSLAAFFTLLVVLVGLQSLADGVDFGDVFVLVVLTAVLSALVVALRALLGSLARPEIVLGADGITLVREERFVPYREIAGVKVHARGVSVIRGDGTQVDLVTWRRGEPGLDDARALGSPGELARRAIAERVAAGVAASRAPSTSEALAPLERAGRTGEEWRAALVSLPRSGVTYRVAGVDDELLERAVEDAAAPLERRVAAAVVLHARAPERAKVRVRVALDATVDPEASRVLEAAAEGEIDEAWLGREARARR